PPPPSLFFPYTTLFRSDRSLISGRFRLVAGQAQRLLSKPESFSPQTDTAPCLATTSRCLRTVQSCPSRCPQVVQPLLLSDDATKDRKSTRLNSSHQIIS